MLRALNRYGTGTDGCVQAWLSLPHSVRVFYPHAYCSRSAAKIASFRVKLVQTQVHYWLLISSAAADLSQLR